MSFVQRIRHSLANLTGAGPQARYHHVRNTSDDMADIDAQIDMLEADTPSATPVLAKPPRLIHSMQTTTTVTKELWVYATYMGPLLVNQGIQRYCIAFAPITAMGQYGSVELAGASLGNSTINILCYSIILGMTSALDTLSTQAVGGRHLLGGEARDLNMLYTFRVLLCICIAYVFLLPMLWYFQPIFELLGVEKAAALMGTTYMRYSLVGLPGYVGYECLRKYCQAQGKMAGPAIAVIVAAPLLIWMVHSDIVGHNTPPLSLGIFWNTAFAAEAVWAYLVFPTHTWKHIPSFHEIRQDLKIVFKLGTAGIVSSCSDWFAWEYLTFVSAWLGNDMLAANAVMLTSATTFFALPAALMNGTPTRVGNFLGAGQPGDARLSARTAIWLSIVIGAVGGLILLLVRDQWTSLFTDDPKVADIVKRVLPFFSIIVALDAYQGCFGGVLRGAGLPMEIASAMLTGHYICGMPLATLFALGFHWGLLGIWGGFSVGLTLVVARLWWLIERNDWVEAARKAQDHVKETDTLVKILSRDETLP